MDLVIGLVQALKADSTLQSLLYTGADGLSVFDHELPADIDFQMPQKVVIVRPHGGPRSFDWLQLRDVRINTFSYGETPSISHEVDNAVYARLKNLPPSVWAGADIKWCNPAAGPMPARDAHYQWPYNVSSWLVRTSDIALS